jgi:hypothetical protein
MTLTRSGRLSIAVLAATAATAVALISTAGDAGAGGGSCPDNKLCVFAGDSRSGQRVKIGGNGVSNKLAREMNNQASSLSNRRDTKVFLYEKRGARGEVRCFPPGVTDNALGDSGFDDVASSTKIANGTSCPGAGPPR